MRRIIAVLTTTSAIACASTLAAAPPSSASAGTTVRQQGRECIAATKGAIPYYKGSWFTVGGGLDTMDTTNERISSTCLPHPSDRYDAHFARAHYGWNKTILGSYYKYFYEYGDNLWLDGDDLIWCVNDPSACH